MTTIKEAEEFAARNMTEDGLIDVFMGIGLVVVGYFWWIDNSAISTIMPFALINLWKVTRTRITEPRVGRVTLHREKRSHVISGRIILAIITLTLVVGVILWWMGGGGEILGTGYYPLFASGPSLLVATIVFFTGVYLKAPRFYAYAGWMLAAVALAIWYGYGPAMAFMLSGFPPLLMGAALFAKFLKIHPKEDNR